MKKIAAALAITLALVMPASPALAHNHLANPSGFCNQSGQGVSPGNSGETNLNPAGKPVGQSNAIGKGNAETAVTKCVVPATTVVFSEVLLG